MYWGGLGTWTIRLFPDSRDQYHRSLDAFYAAVDRWERRDGEPESPRPRNWHGLLPEAPAEFPEKASFRLRRADAVYLQERILASVPESLLAFLVGELAPFDRVRFPWELSVAHDLPARLGRPLTHARNFSEVIWGAPLLYNLMLGERAEREGIVVRIGGESPVDRYRDRLAEWTALLGSRWETFQAWDRGSFWRTVDEGDARVPPPSQRFVNRWLDLVLEEEGPRAVADSAAARVLIEHRERLLKRGRARLQNRRALEMWSGEAGVAQLDYRWPVVQAIVPSASQEKKVKASSTWSRVPLVPPN